MAIPRYPTQLQAIFGELLSRTQQATLEGLVDKEGAFASKDVEGRRYWYFRRRLGRKIDEKYIGPETPELLEQIELLKSESADAKDAAGQRRDLIRILRSGGYSNPDARTGRVLQALAAAGVFRLRGVLVGTHAFRCYSAMLGRRLSVEAALTTDVDIAQFETISIAVGDQIEPSFEKALSAAERFVPIPSLRSRSSSSDWRTPDQGPSVEVLTPLVGPTKDRLVRLPALDAYAQPIRFLDYLIYQAEASVVLHGAGILVNVPTPERFACHKLIVASRRSRADRQKASKDLAQAADLLMVLLEGRRDHLMDAWQDLLARGPSWGDAALKSLAKLPNPIKQELQDVSS